MTEPTYWCIIHHCPGDRTHPHCYWDLLIGPRPGRGKCEFVEATVEWKKP